MNNNGFIFARLLARTISEAKHLYLIMIIHKSLSSVYLILWSRDRIIIVDYHVFEKVKNKRDETIQIV